MRKLEFAEGYTAAQLIERLQQRASHLLKENDRGPEFRPDWRRRAGFTENREEYLTDTPENRRAFNEHYASNALMDSIRFQGPWDANWMTLAAGMAKWAMGALLKIQAMEREIKSYYETVLARDQEIAALKAKVAEAEARVEQVQRNAADQEQSMDDQIQDLKHAKAKMELHVQEMSVSLKEAQHRALEASERAQSWEAMARTAVESATAASNAVAMLREVIQASQAKPRFHDGGIVPNDGTMLVVRER